MQGKLGAAEQVLLTASEMQRSTHARFAREERALAARYVQLEEKRLLEVARVLALAAEREKHLLRESHAEVLLVLAKAKDISPSRELGLFQRKAVARLVKDRVVSQHAHLAALPDDPRRKAAEERRRRADESAELDRVAAQRRQEQRGRWQRLREYAQSESWCVLGWLQPKLVEDRDRDLGADASSAGGGAHDHHSAGGLARSLMVRPSRPESAVVVAAVRSSSRSSSSSSSSCWSPPPLGQDLAEVLEPLRVACFESLILGEQQVLDSELQSRSLVPDGDTAGAVRFRAIRHAAATLGVTR